MGKVIASLVISFLVVFSPVLVQAQVSGTGGFNTGGFGRASFGVNSFNRGSTVSNFRGGFTSRSVAPIPRSVGLRSNRGFINSGSGSRFSNNSASNLTPFNLNTNILAPQPPSALNSRSLIKPINRFNSFNRESTASGFREEFSDRNVTPIGRGVKDDRGSVNLDFSQRIFSPRSLNKTDNPNPTFLRDRVRRDIPVVNLSLPSIKRTDIIQRVDRNGILHLTNISSIPRRDETIKPLVTRSKEELIRSNLGRTLTNSESKRALFFSKSSVRSVKQTASSTTNSTDSARSTRTVFNFFFGSPFFVSPFGFFPTSSFFFGFNPFIFHPLVPSPFFAFHPLVPSPFFTFHPLVPLPVFSQFIFQPLFPSSFFFNPFVPTSFFNTTIFIND